MRQTLSGLLLVFLSLVVVNGQTPERPSRVADDTLLREFESFVRAQMERDRIPGLTIGLLKGGQTWVKAFGYADLENKTPTTENSLIGLLPQPKP